MSPNSSETHLECALIRPDVQCKSMGVIGDEGLREDEAAAACRPGDEMLKKKGKQVRHKNRSWRGANKIRGQHGQKEKGGR